MYNKSVCDFPDTHQDSVMAILPFFHIYAATVIMFHKMAQGIKLVTLAKFQPELFMQAMVKYKTNILFAAPPLSNIFFHLFTHRRIRH